MAGFDERTAAWPKPDSPASVLGQHVIVAMAPGVLSARLPRDGIRFDTAAGDAHVPSVRAAWLTTLKQAATDEQHVMLVELVRGEMAAVLRAASPLDLDVTRRLTELGLDSLMALEFRARLSKALELEKPLPATLVFDHPTLERIAIHLAAEVFELRQPAALPKAGSESPNAGIVEMSEEEAEEVLLLRLQELQS